jgi:hypothetical protein
VSKNESSGKDNFYPEIKRGRGGGWVPSFQLGPKRSAFANLPEDESRFPVATWFKAMLAETVQKLSLTVRLCVLRVRLGLREGSRQMVLISRGSLQL